ncbi:MAG: glutaredoxin family protein [Gammaproteobacteria bacterium]|jgi:glutaredoxin
MPVQLTLYVREGCHLCDDMEQALVEFESEFDFEIRRVPINDHPELEQVYGTAVPVLVFGDEEICRYFLDLNALKRVLN